MHSPLRPLLQNAKRRRFTGHLDETMPDAIGFANKIELNIWIIGTAGLLVTLVAFITLSLQTVRATMNNPVDEIRNE